MMPLEAFRKSHRLEFYILIALVILSVIFKVISAFPTWIHYDESYYLNISLNYIERGQLTPYMWRLDAGTNIIAGSGSGYGILLLTNWMRFIGLSLFNGRVLMILIGLLTAGMMYATAREWWGNRTAGVVAFVFAVVSTSPFFSYIIRMDSFGMLVYSLVLLLHIRAVRTHSRRLHALTGIVVVAGAEFHILALVYLLMLAFYYGLTALQILVRQRRIVLDIPALYFGLGALLAGLIYVAIHVLPDPQGYFAISGRCFQCGRDDLLAKEALRFVRFVLLRPEEFALLVAALMSAVFRRQPEDRHFLTLCAGWIIALVVVSPPPFTHYSYHMWPLIALGTAGFITRGVRANSPLSIARLRFGLAIAAATLALNVGLSLGGAQPFELRKGVQEPDAVTYVRQYIPDNTVVMGSPLMFYFLQNYDNFLAYEADDNPDLRGGESQIAFWHRYHPLVIIGSDGEDNPQLDLYKQELDFQPVLPDLWIAGSLRHELNLPMDRQIMASAFKKSRFPLITAMKSRVSTAGAMPC